MSTATHHYWMSRTPEIKNLCIGQLILPGTHDSGSDKEASSFGNFIQVTQDVSPLNQIKQGIRALDLRVSFHEGYPVGASERFQLFHLFPTGRTVTIDVVSAVLEFFQLARTQQEIIVLDFHQFKDFTSDAHQELQSLLLNFFRDRIIPLSLSALTVGELWEKHPGKNIVVAYNDNRVDPTFWYGVEQRWMGENMPTTAELKAYMDSTINDRKHPHDLVSIQCAKYVLPFHAADDFSDKIDFWFKSEDEHSYIQHFHIINTDWTTRSQLVENCIHANKLRAAILQQHTT